MGNEPTTDRLGPCSSLGRGLRIVAIGAAVARFRQRRRRRSGIELGGIELGVGYQFGFGRQFGIGRKQRVWTELGASIELRVWIRCRRGSRFQLGDLLWALVQLGRRIDLGRPFRIGFELGLRVQLGV